MAAKIHLDPWTDIVGVGWGVPPFMCFAMDIQRGPTLEFQAHFYYSQPYDWSVDLLGVPVLSIPTPTFGRFVTAIRFIWEVNRPEKRGVFSPLESPQDGGWSGGVVDRTLNPVPRFYRLAGSSWTALGSSHGITPSGLPALPITRTINRGTVFAGLGNDNGGGFDPTPNLAWAALAGSPFGTSVPSPPGASNGWKQDTSVDIHLKGIGLTRVGEDGDGQAAAFNYVPPSFEIGGGSFSGVPYQAPLAIGQQIDSNWWQTSGSYPTTFETLSVSRAGMTWTYRTRTYSAVAFCLDQSAGSGDFQAQPGTMWVLGQLQT
jgi:hypothetical protein